MATAPVSQALNRGGAFLITPCRPEDVFTPADFSDDQRLIGQTAEEFVQKEVMPAIPELEAHKDEHLMAQMLKKAGEIGLLGGGIPEAYGGSGLDKIFAAILAENRQRRIAFLLLSLGAASRLRFDGVAHARRPLARRQELHSERPENVDHQRRVRRRLRRLRQN